MDSTAVAVGTTQAARDFDRMGASVDRVGTQATRSLASVSLELKNVVGGALALYGSVSSVLAVSGALFTASTNAQRLSTQLNFATQGNGIAELAFVGDVARKLGLELNSTAKAYAGFASAARGTSLEGKGARAVFEAVAQASAVMGLSVDEASGALLAIQQMMSKGVVSAEEFRGQLGERMPIALQAGANALGVTTAEFSKLMETGQVVAADFLPKFAVAIKEMLGDSVASAANRLDASTAQMGNAWERLKRTIGDSGVSQALANEARGLSDYMDSLSDAMGRAKANGSGLAGELGGGLFQALKRMPFDVASASGNLLNGTINLLTGSIFDLKTNINLLPASMQSAAGQSATLSARLAAADADLVQLQRRLALVPDNIYLQSETHQAFLLTEQLRAAQRAQQDLAGGGYAGRGSVNPQTTEQAALAQKNLSDAMATYATKVEKANKAVAELKATHGSLFTPEMEKRVRDQLNPPKTGEENEAAKLFKQTIDAQIEELKRKATVEELLNKRSTDMLQIRLQLGLVSEREYLEQVAAAELQGLGKTRELMTQELSLAGKKKDSLKEQAALNGQIAQLDEKRLSRELQLQNALLVLDEKRRKEAEALRNASLNTAQQQLDVLDEKNRSTQLEIEGIGLTEAAMHRLTTARMDEIIARQQERIEVLKSFDLAGQSQDLIDIEIRKLEALKNARTLNGQKYGVEQIAKINEAWLTLKNDVYTGLTDSLYRAFEAGNGFFETFWAGIKNTLKTTVLKVAVQGVMNGVTSMLGLGSSDSGSGVLGSLGSISNLFSVGSKIYTAMTTGFAGAIGSAVSTVFGGVAGNAAIASSLTGSASSAAAAASAASIAGGGTGAGAGIGASIGSGAAAIPIVGWIIAGMMAAGNLYGKGFSASTIDSKTAKTTGYGLDMKLNTEFLTNLGISEKTANIITGAPLVSKAISYISGESRSGGQYTTANGATKLVSGPDGGEIAGATVQSAIDTTVTGINDLFKTLGSTASVALYNSGLESSKNGKGFTYAGGTLSDGTKFGEQKDDPNSILHYMNNRGSKTPEEALNQFSLELQQTTIQALQAATDVPEAIKDQLKDVDANKLDAAGIKAVFEALDTTINEVKIFGLQMEALPFKNLQGLSFDATASLLKLAGGLESFNTSLSSYYKNFYTEEEQRAQITKNLASQFTTLGLQMPTTRDAFKALVEAQDPLTEKGRSTLLALLDLQDAFASVTAASVSTAESLKAEATARLNTVTSNASAAYSALERAVAAQRTSAELARDVASEQVNSIKGVFDTLKSNVDALYGSVTSASAIQATQGQAFIAQALATAKSTGYLPDNTALSEAITAARGGVDSGAYSSQFEADYARLSLAGTLSQLQELSGTQLSNAELSLKAATAQVDGLTHLLENAKLQLDAATGIDNSVKSVAAAVGDLNTTIRALYAERAGQGLATSAGTNLSIPAFASGGDHSGGVRLVGENGPELELTGASRIYSASQTRDILRPADGGDSAALVAEVRALREDNRAQALALVQVQSRLGKVIDRWDVIGMPAVRDIA
nr:tape measure protein [uncultured Albidiferax sp.]